jgi:hypothetical protein
MQRMGAQTPAAVIEGDAGFVAGSFDAEYEHGVGSGRGESGPCKT